MRRLVLVALLALPSLGAAQMPSRQVMREDLEHARRRTIAFLDAAPDSMMGFRSTPGVRTFAQQIDHIASSSAYLTALAVKGEKQPPAVLAGDTAVFLHDKAALRDRLNKLFDYVGTSIGAMSDADFSANTSLLNSNQPRYRWYAMILEHAAFTLGQTVPYLRLNNVTPPMYLPF